MDTLLMMMCRFERRNLLRAVRGYPRDDRSPSVLPTSTELSGKQGAPSLQSPSLPSTLRQATPVRFPFWWSSFSEASLQSNCSFVTRVLHLCRRCLAISTLARTKLRQLFSFVSCLGAGAGGTLPIFSVFSTPKVRALVRCSARRLV